MTGKLEKLITLVYKKWKQEQPKISGEHPDEEALVCFLEGRLSNNERERIIAHLLDCDSCLEALVFSLKMRELELQDVPSELIARIKDLPFPQEQTSVLEIFLALKENLLEILNTTGDVLVGQELIPAPILRSRKIQDFKDEVTILKDFKDIRVEIKVENKLAKVFNLIVTVKDKETQRVMKDLRVTLIKESLELESYLTDSGSVIFEHLFLGKYVVEVSTIGNKLASILLDIKT